ncbi:MAG: hypothetical protein ACRETN_03940 [Nevskiales bacterium]
MADKIKLPEGDWPVSFEAVRLHQMLEFRKWSLRDKIQAMEDMAELVEHFKRMRERARTKPKSDKP